MLEQILHDYKGLIVDATEEITKRLKKVVKNKWYVGFNDRGLGHGDYGVMTKFNGKQIVIATVICKEIAEEICKTHNEHRKIK